jgi:hypothetical protein
MNEEVEDVLVIGEDDFEHTDLNEHDDFLIVEDPTAGDQESWCLLFVKGDYTDFVVRFDDISMNTGTGDLAYSYTILSTGESEEVEIDTTDFTNYLSSALSKVITDMHESGSQRYHDLETGEEVK